MLLKKNEFLFILAFFFLQLNYMLTSSTLYYIFENKDYIFQIISYFSLILLLIACITSKMNFKDLMKLISVCVYYFYIKNGVVVILLLIILISKYINLKKVLKVILYLNIILLSLILFLYLVGAIPESIEESFRKKNGIRIERLHPGFRNPNSFAMFLGNIQILYMYVYNKNKLKLKSIIMFIITCLIYKITGSRTMLLCNTIFIILTFFNIKYIFYKLLMGLILLLPILSYILPRLYIGTYLDRLSSWRLTTWYFHIKNTGESFFGKGALLNLEYPLDNSYLRIMLIFGIINLCLLIYLYISQYSKILSNYKEKKYILNILIYFLIYGYFESILILPSVNFSLLLLNEKIEKE